MNYWLLLEKSDETRISKSFDGYQDVTGEVYFYDSLVPNHTKLAPGDSIVLRKDKKILGVGEIAKVLEKDDTKSHRRCPECGSTDIRERTTKSPKWKCGICTNEFSKPKETTVEIRSYEATIDGFQRLNFPPLLEMSNSALPQGMVLYHNSQSSNSIKQRSVHCLMIPFPCHQVGTNHPDLMVKAFACLKPNENP